MYNVFRVEKKLEMQIEAFDASVNYLAEFYRDIPVIWSEIEKWLSLAYQEIQELEGQIKEYTSHGDIVSFVSEVQSRALDVNLH